MAEWFFRRARARKKSLYIEQAFDAGSDLVALKSWCESELKVKFIIAPRQHHEFVGTAEVNNDILTRWAESMLQRCYKGTSFLLPARCYAQYLLNFRPCAGQNESRYQRYFGKIPIINKDRQLYLRRKGDGRYARRGRPS